ncbi:MAG TPA: SGNH/GDSL hydrolase family protein [Planctomycetota bacterium]|nr:SGNH/GDSL hydrolase family protein [Planctomycetota bacterium]
MSLPFDNGDRILFQGDSITDCGCRNPDNMNPLGTGYVSIIRGMLAAQYPELKLTILNRGVSGDRTAELLKRWDEDTLALKPTWLSIKIGVNDVWRKRGEWNGQGHIQLSDYKQNLHTLIDRSYAGGIKNIILVSPTTIDDDLDSDLNKLLGEYDEAVREMAKLQHATYVPARESLLRAIKEIPTVRWTSDGCHPTVAGHALIAGVWIKTLEGCGIPF